MSTEQPQTLLDVVMLVHANGGWADLAIRAVEHNTRNKYRLIIVDMAATDPKARETIDAAEKRGHTVVRLAENRSFSHGCNAGAARGTAPYLCFLNDDALVTEGWDTALMQDATPKHVGLVGARSNYASGAQGNPGFIGKPPFLVFVCVALRRAVWDLVGPMDEITFDGFSSEDLDYSWRVVKAGLELKVSSAYVLHAGSRTLAIVKGDAEARARNDAHYNAKLLDKWGKDWVAAHSKMAQRVFVVSYHAEEWTRVKFMDDFVNLKAYGGYEFTFYRSVRAPIHHARNTVANYALDNGYDVLIQLDDDATFPPDLIRRLLAHQKDVVAALAYQRKTPHLPCVFEVGDDGLLGKPLEGIEHTGLRRVDVTGYHCSAIRTDVFRRLREGVKDAEGNVIVPGTRQFYGGFDNKVGEDFAFSLNCKKLGIPIYCDTDLISGHIGEPIVVDEAYVAAFKARGGR